jgi:hypothetical protein
MQRISDSTRTQRHVAVVPFPDLRSAARTLVGAVEDSWRNRQTHVAAARHSFDNSTGHNFDQGNSLVVITNDCHKPYRFTRFGLSAKPTFAKLGSNGVCGISTQQKYFLHLADHRNGIIEAYLCHVALTLSPK